jgi:hypothetical protein
LLSIAATIVLTSCIGVGPAVVSHRVYGTVVEATTHRPIANARVALQDNPNVAAATSADGAFNIPSQRALKVQFPGQENDRSERPPIVVTAPGYRTTTVETFNDRHEIALTRE